MTRIRRGIDRGQRPPYDQRKCGGSSIELEEAIRCAIDGDALIFVGAGLSFLAYQAGGKRVPDASAFVDLLLEQPVGTGSKHPLDRVSGAVIRKRGADFVYDLIMKNFEVFSVDEKLETMYALPWKRIYTTNYDNAAEVARKGVFPISSITTDEPFSQAKTGSVVHLNGFIKRLSPANVEQKLLLTDTSYAASRLIDTGWLSFFEQDIRTSRAVIFVGYSLYDFQIDQALLQSEILDRKAFFFISPDADEIEVSTLERYGCVVNGGIDTLVDAIRLARIDYAPSTFVRGYTSLRELTVLEQPYEKDTAAQVVNNQLVYGILPEQQVLLSEQVYSGLDFLVLRQQDKDARKALQSGPHRDFLFLGEIASGKSASTLNLAQYLVKEGYRVYLAQKTETLNSDLRGLSEVDSKTAVIFDGFSKFRNEIEEYAHRRPDNHRIVMSERSVIHELIADFITGTKGLGPVFEIPLDKIDSGDVPFFEALTNFGGFWGDRGASSAASRAKYIQEKLDSSLYRLLIEIIESKKVQEEIKLMFQPLTANRRVSKVFISALIVNNMNFTFTMSEWLYLFDQSTMRTLLSNYADQIKHFLSADTSNIYVRNGLISSHLLRAFADDELVRECLVSLYERASRSSNERKWQYLMIELTKFSSIEPMFSGYGKKHEIFRYYDAIRSYGNTRNNSDYWLQIGIASTVLEDFERGVRCFKEAYGRERAKDRPNLLKIDNYSARFDLLRAVEEADHSAAFDLFVSANERLSKQIFLDSNRHYPFKTGRSFSAIATRHFDHWSDGQRSKFVSATDSIRRKALEWKATKQGFSVDVDILIKETGILLNRLKQGSSELGDE